MLDVITPAATTALTSLAMVKGELGLSGADEDIYLMAQIERASAEICSYLGVVAATDGTRTLGRETLAETFIGPMRDNTLTLARTPVTDILSVIVNEDEELVAGEDYEINGSVGFLYRSVFFPNWLWDFSRIEVTYDAGWLLPNDEGRTLPHDIEGAALSLIKAGRAGRGRDPLVKAEDVPGVLRTEYWVGSVTEGGAMPPDVASRLSMHRRLSI